MQVVSSCLLIQTTGLQKRGDYMQYKTHVAGGVALGYVLYNNVDALSHYVNDSPTFMVATAGLVIGSLMPDIDIKTSYLSQKTKLVSFFTSKLFKHRGYTHSIVGVLTFSLLLFFIMEALGFSDGSTKLFTLSFMIGMISHVVLDMFTWSGVKLFYPYDKRVNIGSYRSGLFPYAFGEWMISIALFVVAYKNMQGLL